MAGKITHSKKELDELRQRLEAERAELQVQLTTIEETSFATSQSDISGEVSFDEENADAGTFTFERERDLSIENNVRDLHGQDRPGARPDGGRDLRDLLALRQAHREGPSEGPAVRRSLHQGRASPIPAVGG